MFDLYLAAVRSPITDADLALWCVLGLGMVGLYGLGLVR